MRILTFLILTLISYDSYSQIKKTHLDYPNGRTSVKGKNLTCPDYNSKHPCYKGTCRKIGKWTYYYQNGKTKKIESYKKISDCHSIEVPDGLWKYYDEKGNLVKEDEFRNGELWQSDIIEFSRENYIAGEVIVRNGIRDTLFFKNDSLINLNYILNGSFDYYNGKPVPLITNGQNQIEDQIPFWITPNDNTPDYYNQYRRINQIPDNVNHEYNAKYDYAGIILYHAPSGDFSEYITGLLKSPLIAEKKYCIRLSIRLSQNSGYYINKLGVQLSNNVPSIPNSINEQIEKPQILLPCESVERDLWTTLCSYYEATGKEKHITIGRYVSLSETIANEIRPINHSSGELNQSAYYLIDKVELLEDTLSCRCNAPPVKPDINEFSLISPDDSLKFSVGKIFVLSNIYFDFDKSELLPDSFIELIKLYNMLNSNNHSITILGHTDNIGTMEYNYELSLLRAKAVADWLINNGIDKERLDFEGYGASVPIVNNDSDYNRSINRRVEFRINTH